MQGQLGHLASLSFVAKGRDQITGVLLTVFLAYLVINQTLLTVSVTLACYCEKKTS